MNTISQTNLVRVECPICKIRKEVEFPKSIINQASQLTTVSIRKGIICEHHFQMFIDKNFKVRGYQKVDYEFGPKKKGNESNLAKKIAKTKESDKELFENLILEKNYVEYKPKKQLKKLKEMTLKEIYDEFWELINDDNEEFMEFIKKDNRRRKLKTENPL